MLVTMSVECDKCGRKAFRQIESIAPDRIIRETMIDLERFLDSECNHCCYSCCNCKKHVCN